MSGAVLRTQTDERLCALAAAGNELAFSAIFERYRRELRAHAARIVRADRADDVVQQAMLGAWTTLLTGPPIVGLRAWIHRVVHNAALDTIAKRGYDDGELPGSSIAPALTDELAEGRLTAGAALAAIAALPESQRRALTLTAIEGRSGQEAALSMGISESAMRQLVYRARSGVRAAVSALTPVTLVNWLVGAGGAAVTPAAVGLAGGGAATAAKVIAVIGVTATLGVTHPLQSHHGPRSAPRAPASPGAPITPDRGPPRVAARRVALLAPAKLIRAPSGGQIPGERQATGARQDSSSGQTGNGSDRQSASHDATGAAGEAGSAPQTVAGDGGRPGSQHDVQATNQIAGDQPAADRSGPRQAGETSSGASGAGPAPPPPDAQSGNGN